MFYSQFILAKKGPLGTIWIAAHLERKLRRTQVAETDIGVTVDSILCPDVPIALRLSGHLLLGVVRIYSRQVNYLFNDCSETLGKIKQAFQSAKVDLPPEATTAPFHTITLPETFDFDELELVPDSENSFLHLNGKFVDQNVTTREQITLQDTVDHNPYLGSSQFGLDERFGDGNYSSLGIEFDEDFLADKVRSSAGPSTPTPLPKTEILLIPGKENASMPLTHDDRLDMDVAPQIDCGNEITPMEIDSHCEPVKSGSDGVDPLERKENGILGSTERDICPPPLNQGISADPLFNHAISHTAVKDFVFDSSRHERPGHALRTLEACTPDLNQEYRPPDEPSTPALVDETPLPLCKEPIMESSGRVSPSLKDHSESVSTFKTNATNAGVSVRHHVNAEDAANLPPFFNEAPERIALPAIVAGIAMPATVSGSSSQHQVENCLVSSTGEVIQSVTSASFPGVALCQSASNNENTRECSAQLVNVRTFSVGENTSALTSLSKNVNEFSAKEGVAVVSTTCPNFPEQTFSQQSRTVVLHESPKYPGNDADHCLTTSGAALPQLSSTSFSFDNGHQVNALNQLSSAPSQQANALNQLSSAPSQQLGFAVSPCGPEPVRVGTESSSSQSQHPLMNTLTNAQDSRSTFAFPSTNSFPVGLSVGHQSLLSLNTVGTESSSCQQLSTSSNAANDGQNSRPSSATPPCTDVPMASPCSQQMLVGSGSQPPSFQPFSALPNIVADGQASGASFSPSTSNNLPIVGPVSAQITAGVELEPPNFQSANTGLDTVIGGQALKLSDTNLPSFGPYGPQNMETVGAESSKFQSPNTRLDTTDCGQSLNKSFASSTSINPPMAGLDSSQTRAGPETETGQSSKAPVASPTGINPPEIGANSSQTQANVGSEPPSFQLHKTPLDMRTSEQGSNLSFTHSTGLNLAAVGLYSPQASIITGTAPQSLQTPHTGLNSVIGEQGSTTSFTSPAGINSPSVGQYTPQTLVGFGTITPTFQSPNTGLNTKLAEQGPNASFILPAGGVNPPSVGSYTPKIPADVGTEPPRFPAHTGSSTVIGGQGPNTSFTSPTGNNSPSIVQYSSQTSVGTGSKPSSCQLPGTPLTTMTSGQISTLSFTSSIGANHQTSGVYGLQSPVGSKRPEFQPSSPLLGPPISEQASRPLSTSPTYTNLSQTARIETHYPKENVLYRNVEHPSVDKNLAVNNGLFLQPEAHQSVASFFSYKNPSMSPMAMSQSDASSFAGIDRFQSSMGMNQYETLRSGHNVEGRGVSFSLLQQGFTDERIPGLELDRSKFYTPSTERSMQEYLQQESTKTPISRDEAMFAARRPSVPSTPSLSSVPRDDDVLASILGQKPKDFSIISTPNAPKPPKISTASKRMKFLSRTVPKRRKVELDTVAVLHGDVIRQQLANTEDIRRERRKAPCTRREVWRFLRECEGQENFDEPTLPELSSDMNELYHDVLHGREAKPIPPTVAREMNEACLEAELDNIQDSDLLAHYVKRISARDSCLSQATGIKENYLSETNTEQVSPNADVCLSHAAGNSEDGTIRMKLGPPNHDGDEEMASQHDIIDGSIRTGDAEMPRTEKPFEPEVGNKVLDGRAGLVMNGNEEQVYSCHEPQVGEDAGRRDVMGAGNVAQAARAFDLRREPGSLGQGQGISYISHSLEGAQPPNTSMLRCFSEASQPQDTSPMSTFQDGAQLQSTLVGSSFQEGAQPQETSMVSTIQNGAQLQNILTVSGFREGAQPQQDTSLVSSGLREGAQPQQNTSLVRSFAEHARLEGTSLVSNFPEGARSQFTALVNNFPEGAQPHQGTSLVSGGFREGAQPQQHTPLVSSFAEHARFEGASLVSNFPEGARSQFTAPVSNFPKGAQPQQDPSSVSGGFREGAQLQRDTSLVSNFAEHAQLEGTSLGSNFPEGARPQFTALASAQPLGTPLVSSFSTDAQPQAMPMGSTFSGVAHLQDTSMVSKFSDGAHFGQSGRPQDILPASSFPDNAQPVGASLVSSFSTDALPQAMSMGSTLSAGAHLQGTSMGSKFSDGTQLQDTSQAGSLPFNAQLQYTSPVSNFADGARVQDTLMVVQRQDTSPISSFQEGALQDTFTVSGISEGLCKQPAEEGTQLTIKPDAVITLQQNEPSPISNFPEGALQDTSTASSFSEGPCKQPVEEGTQVTIKPDAVITIHQNEPSSVSSCPDGALQENLTTHSFSEGLCKQTVEEGTRLTIKPDTVITLQQNEPSPRLDLQDSVEEVIPMSVDGTIQPPCKQSSEHNPEEMSICGAASIDKGNAKATDYGMIAPSEEGILEDGNDKEMTAAEREGVTDVVNEDNDIAYTEMDYSSDEQEITLQDESGWSTRSRNVGKYLKTLFQDMESGSKRLGPKKILGLDRLLARRTRREAARMFFETLVLKTKDYIHVEQDVAYQDILLYPNSKLLKAEF